MKNNSKFLVVFNTCGIRANNALAYIRGINSLLLSNLTSEIDVVMSSCLNSLDCRRIVETCFGNRISYVYIDDKLTVNVTFNKTCQVMTEKNGLYAGYIYVDSGVVVPDPDILQRGIDLYNKGNYGMVTYQVDTDTAIYDTKIEDANKDHEVPIGGACNLHFQIFSPDIYLNFGNKIIPDVFAAFCTESTFSFLTASIEKKWAILGGNISHHLKGIDGASLCVPHISPTHSTPWNNLLCGRNAMDFINSQEAINCGLGYEECNGIMMHDPSKYEGLMPKYPNELRQAIQKFFFLTEEELSYKNINLVSP